jgi:hypothetical protein
MKTRNYFITMMTVITALAFTSCENSLFDKQDKDNGILPERFMIDIPGSLSNDTKSASLKSTEIDTVNGNLIYWHLNTFIAVGEGAAKIVQATIWSISKLNIDNVISLSYTSDEDNRVKNVDVIADAEYQGRLWQYGLTLTDAESEGNSDGGIGMQIFWNKNPIEGIALYKPYNLNRVSNSNLPELMGSIEYSEKGTEKYDAFMIVEITGLPVEASHPFELETMKMFVGKNDNYIDVFGNSDHPKARFNTYDNETKGFNWAFVASGDIDNDIAAAEVGLPLSSADITSRSEILDDNSVKKVLTREMTNFIIAAYASVGITLQPNEVSAFLAPYLKNAEAPGYFNSGGFVKGGVAPNGSYSEVEDRIESLVPYNPSDIGNLQIEFGY